jgi:hypothetical protein
MQFAKQVFSESTICTDSCLTTARFIEPTRLLSNSPVLAIRVITVFTVFRLLTDFVCLYNYEF